MFRYQTLLKRALDPDTEGVLSLRELSRKMKIPVPSMHNYAEFDTLPRVENISKMATYFGEDPSSLFSEDDDLTAELIAKVRKLTKTSKQQLLKELKQK